MSAIYGSRTLGNLTLSGNQLTLGAALEKELIAPFSNWVSTGAIGNISAPGEPRGLATLRQVTVLESGTHFVIDPDSRLLVFQTNPLQYSGKAGTDVLSVSNVATTFHIIFQLPPVNLPGNRTRGSGPFLTDNKAALGAHYRFTKVGTIVDWAVTGSPTAGQQAEYFPVLANANQYITIRSSYWGTDPTTGAATLYGSALGTSGPGPAPHDGGGLNPDGSRAGNGTRNLRAPGAHPTESNVGASICGFIPARQQWLLNQPAANDTLWGDGGGSSAPQAGCRGYPCCSNPGITLLGPTAGTPGTGGINLGDFDNNQQAKMGGMPGDTVKLTCVQTGFSKQSDGYVKNSYSAGVAYGTGVPPVASIQYGHTPKMFWNITGNVKSGPVDIDAPQNNVGSGYSYGAAPAGGPSVAAIIGGSVQCSA